jgi:uncharacterized protein YbbC (DUF1343 family)/CubicO group peptidase (beta-lactamase class C family)
MPRKFVTLACLLVCLLTQVPSTLGQPAARPSPSRRAARQSAAAAGAARFDRARLGEIEKLVEAAIARKELPGAVVAVGTEAGVAWQASIGRRAVLPSPEPMTADTIFDAASLTKVVATTTAVMMLVEQGKLRLTDRVAVHVPGFERYGKRDITIRHLLTHSSGLRPDLEFNPEWNGYETAISKAIDEVPVARPDERVIYSDINFFLLSHIVGLAAGEPLDEFTRKNVFVPLGMKDTMFRPPASLVARIAPTEKCRPISFPCGQSDGTWLRGVVHDPTARRMNNVAGHAGLFTTAADLARFARMLINGGQLEGVRILSPLTVARMTSPSTAPGERNVRGLGWDINSSFSANKGDLLPTRSFGHTGFTGTSMWIDPGTKTFILFLSNRVHPDGKGDVTALRARVANVVAGAIRIAPAPLADTHDFAQAPASGAVAARPSTVRTMTGIDVLQAEGFARLAGRKVGLLTNHTGRTRGGQSTIDAFHAAKGLTLVALFSPEHGIRGILDEEIPSSVDEKTGLTIHSLYGRTRRATPEMLQGIDTMVVDLQDIGSRFYTYMSSLGYLLETAAPLGIEVVVLDRPNPINGWQIEGPKPDPLAEGAERSFIAYFPTMPVRHGMTLGELARLFNDERKIGAKLTVVEMKGWSREAWWDETALMWVNPSPNMRSLTQATLYPGIGAVEYANLSVGRGTDAPFERIGAPWIDGVQLAEALNARNLPGIRFYPILFTPASSVYKGEECQGVYFMVSDRTALRPVRVGLELVSVISKLFPGKLDLKRTATLYGSADQLARALTGEDPAQLEAQWAADEVNWRTLRSKYLIYR